MSPERKSALLDEMAAQYPRSQPVVRQLDKLPEPPPRPTLPARELCEGLTVAQLERVLRDLPEDAPVVLTSGDGRYLDVTWDGPHPAGNAVVVLYGVEQGEGGEAEEHGDPIRTNLDFLLSQRGSKKGAAAP